MESRTMPPDTSAPLHMTRNGCPNNENLKDGLNHHIYIPEYTMKILLQPSKSYLKVQLQLDPHKAPRSARNAKDYPVGEHGGGAVELDIDKSNTIVLYHVDLGRLHA